MSVAIQTTVTNLIIGSETVLLFDMDGTLIDSDFANFLSYQQAIREIVEFDMEIKYSPNERFNRTALKKKYPNLTDAECQEIIQRKELVFETYLALTKLNLSTVEVLVKYYKTNTTVLVTNCREDRAVKILKHHNLYDKFNYLFFRKTSEGDDWINKYKNVIENLNLMAESVVVFENEIAEIKDAILAGVLICNIVNLNI